MDTEEKERIARYRDSSSKAIARRLRAARVIVEPNQKLFAKLIGVPQTTYNSQEVKGSPRFEVLDYLYRNHRIGANFILWGEVINLPADVQDALTASLLAGD